MVFFMSIPPYRICRRKPQSRLNGVTGAYLATIHAVLKSNDIVSYTVANEIICSTLGIILQLPIPPAAIVASKSKPNVPIFASLDFNVDRGNLPGIVGSQCFATLPDLSTGLLLFDAWIGNSDRHSGNLQVDYLSTPATMQIFDQSHALFGYRAGMGTHRLLQIRDRLGMSGGSVTHDNRHCLLDHISDDRWFSKWLGRIRVIPDFVIQDLCTKAASLGITAAEADAAQDFLLYRRDKLEDIINDNRCEFPAIQQWSLPPRIP